MASSYNFSQVTYHTNHVRKVVQKSVVFSVSVINLITKLFYNLGFSEMENVQDFLEQILNSPTSDTAKKLSVLQGACQIRSLSSEILISVEAFYPLW